MNRLCPCLSQKFFFECCEPYINKQCFAETPEKLMRSRYSAYSLKNIDYLISTHHSSKRSKNCREELIVGLQNTQWLGLIIHKTPKPVGDTAQVEFSAYYKNTKEMTGVADGLGKQLASSSNSKANWDSLPVQQIHELSTFLKEEQKWFYSSGDFLTDHQLTRNDQCFCGSLKKYKRCHGR